MSSLTFTISALRSGQSRNSQRLLAGCLLVSVALHALALVLLPGWARPVADLSVPALEVVMVVAAPPAAVAAPLPAAAPDAAPQRRVLLQQRRRVPPGAPIPAPVVAPQAVAEVPAAAVNSEPPRVVETPASAARVESPVTPPLFNAAYLHNPAPAYPVTARRRGDEGTVLLQVLVGSDGVPLRMEIDQSSGSSPLDKAALDAVGGWRFVPARRGSENIEGWVRVPVVFRLKS